MLYENKLLTMIKHFGDTLAVVTTAGISLATIGTWISIISGLAALFYTGLKIYDWFADHRKNKNQPK